MKVRKLLKAIKNKESAVEEILKAKSGKDFEERISSKLISEGEYFAMPTTEFKKMECFKKVKETILNENISAEMFFFKELELVSKTPRIISQPFGIQQSPDLLLIKDGKCLPIELKFTEKKSSTPTWNSGLPRLKFLYIYGSFELRDVVFFKGEDLLTETERIETLELVESSRDELKKRGEEVIENFQIYLRPMYNQKGNIWNSDERDSLEKNALEWGVFF